MSNQTIKIGQTILVRHGFGRCAPARAVVEGIEITSTPRAKDGDSVTEVSHDVVRENRALFTLRYEGSDSSNWAYSEQVVL